MKKLMKKLNRTAAALTFLPALRKFDPEERDKSFYLLKRHVHNTRRFRLSEINKNYLEREENKCQIQTSDLLYYESNQLPSNEPCEDRLLVAQVAGTETCIFSVIDGHGGWQCAHAIKHRLPYYLALYMLEGAELTWRNPMIREDWILPIQGDDYNLWLEDYVFDLRTAQSFNHRYNRKMLQDELINFNTQLARAFEDLDEDIGTEAIPEEQRITKDTVSRLVTASSGACCCTAIVKDGTVHVAGLGDCRAVLGSLTPEGNMRATVLTEEHRTYNPIERERLIREHPHEDEDIMFFDERLCGILQPTRAFGDVSLKWSAREKVLMQYVFDDPAYVPNYISPPYLSCTPDVRSTQLDQNSQFLIIATDGLWDGMSDDESVKLIQNKPSDVNSATWLIQNSLAQHNEKRLSKILSIPPGPICRNVRDDISVIVIYFNT